MKTEIKVTTLYHEELVNLLSTALEGSNWFGASYDRNIYHSITETRGDCFEDKLADMLLSGHKITIIDYYAEGDKYSNKCTGFDDDENAIYEIGLEDILKVASTTIGYKILREVIGYDKEYGDEFDEVGTGDYWTADAFLQRVVFGEEIYG